MRARLAGCGFVLGAFSLGATAACDKVRSLVQVEKTESSEAGTAPVASAGSERIGEGDAVCQVEAHKVWGKYANRRTGITVTRLGKRVALGVALGNSPHVLVIEPSGEGKLMRLSAPAGSPLAKDLTPAQGTRDMQRVTPALINGRIGGYADYRDKYKNGRRRIACGAVDSKTTLLAFDGEPLLDSEAKPKADAGAPHAVPATPPVAPVASAAAKPDAAAPGAAPAPVDAGVDAKSPVNPAEVFRSKLQQMARAVRALKPKADAGADAKAPAAAAASATATATGTPKHFDKPVSEMRDCRSFVAADGQQAWALGSELHGEPAGTKMKWEMRLVVLPAPGATTTLLHTVAMPEQPKELYTFESPAAEQLRDGSFALAARYRGALMAWTLTPSKEKRSARTYGGGYPTLVHFVPDGMDYLLLTSQETQDNHYAVRFGRIEVQSSTLPASLVKPTLEGAASLAEPSLARVGKQRWLSYQAGERREGQLTIVPVDATLNAAGRPYAITEGQRTVYESIVLGIEGDRLLAVFMQNSDAGAELVSEVLSCKVQS